MPMTNVVQFHNRMQRRLPEEAPAAVPAPAIADMVARVRTLQSRAKGEIERSIVLLDLAAQHAREIAGRIIDPTARAAFEQHVASIDHALEVARERASQL